MPLYQYEAKTKQGQVLKGTLEAPDEAVVVDILRQKNHYPILIKPYKETSNIDLDTFKKVSIKDIAIFCRQFSFILSAGINILRALEIAKNQTDNKKLKKMLDKVFSDVQRGQTLSEAMRTHKDFPDMLINMVEVGEASGTLDNIMDRMAAYYDKEYKQQQKVKQALTYPAVVSIFALVVVLVLVVKVLPTFTSMFAQFPGAQLPTPTRIIMAISNTLITKWWLILVVIAIVFTMLKIYFKTETGSYKLDRFKIKAPIFGKMNRKIVTARFARTFGTLMGSGVPLMQSVAICSQIVGNAVYSRILKATRQELERGTGLGEILEKEDIFPSMLTQMIKIGEESGTLDTILEKTAEFYDTEVEATTAQLTTMIEPVIIIVLSAVVGFIVVSIILPIFQMYNAMGNQ